VKTIFINKKAHNMQKNYRLTKEAQTKFNIISGYNPIRKVKKPKGKKIKNSLRSRSLKNRIECCFIFPKMIRLQSQRLYPAPKTIPQPANKALQLFVLKHPIKTKNSPTKLLVAGSPKLANVNMIK